LYVAGVDAQQLERLVPRNDHSNESESYRNFLDGFSEPVSADAFPRRSCGSLPDVTGAWAIRLRKSA